MSIKEAMQKAVVDSNATMAGRIADHMRFKYGMNYNAIRDAFTKTTGIDSADFELLMYYADTEGERV